MDGSGIEVIVSRSMEIISGDAIFLGKGVMSGSYGIFAFDPLKSFNLGICKLLNECSIAFLDFKVGGKYKS